MLLCPLLGNGSFVGSATIPGVHPTGPYHLDSVNQPFHVRLPDIARCWAEHVPAPPQLLVLSAGAWDLARLTVQEHPIKGRHALPEAVMWGYYANLTRVVRLAKQSWGSHTPMFGLNTAYRWPLRDAGERV